MDERPQFGVELLRAGPDTAVIALEGEVDIYTSPQLKEALLAGIEDGATMLCGRPRDRHRSQAERDLANGPLGATSASPGGGCQAMALSWEG
jgi:hypothetical protein